MFPFINLRKRKICSNIGKNGLCLKLFVTIIILVFNVKPFIIKVILLSQSVVRYFLYLIIYRENNGDWFVYMRSLAHKELARIVQVGVQNFHCLFLMTSRSCVRTKPGNSKVSYKLWIKVFSVWIVCWPIVIFVTVWSRK